MKISFVIITARDNYPYTGRSDLHVFEPMIESLRNQTMKGSDFELIIVDVLYNERKDYFKDLKLPFHVKHIPSAPNLWHENGLVGICTQYNKGIIYADGEIIFFTGDGYMFIPEFCERLWKYYTEGYVPLAWYFFDNTFVPENQRIVNSEPPFGVSYNMSGYVGKNVNIDSIDHRPLHAFKNDVGNVNKIIHNASWEWWFGCSSAPLEAMLKINGFDQRFDGDRMLLDCDVGSRLELAGHDKFGLFKDLFIVHAQTNRAWSTKAGLTGATSIKCNFPLIHWSRNFNHYIANDHENIDEDIKWCKEVYCVKKCSLRNACKKDHPWQYPFEHKAGYGFNCDKKWFDFWRTHQIKINLTEERNKRISGDEKYKEGTFT